MATSPSQKVITPLGAVDLSMAKAFGTPQNLLAAIRSGVIKAEPVTPSAAPAATTPKVDTLNIGKPTVTPTTTPTVTSSGLGANVLGRVAEKVTGTPVATGPVAPPGTQSVVPPPSTVVKKQEPLKPITNIEEAQRFVNGAPNSYYRYGVGVGGMGKYIPSLKDLYSDLEYYALKKMGGIYEIREKKINRIYEELTKAYFNPRQYALDEVHKITKRIVTAGSKSTYNPNDYTLDNNNLQKTIKYLLENENVNVSALQSVISNATKLGIEQAQQDIEYNIQANKPRGIDRFFDFAELAMGSIALPAMGNVLAGSLGVSATAGNAIANTIAGITNGGDPQEVLKRVVAGMTAYEAGEYVAALSKIKDPVIQNTLGNAVTQGTNAALLREDVKTALLAGAAGGAIAGGTLKATDDRAIAAAAGEYTKNIASGMSSADAMRNALIDFVLTDRGDAEEKIKKTVEEGSQASAVKPGSQLGEPSAGIGDVDISAPSSISSLTQFKTLPGETGNEVIKITDSEGVVTYKKDIKRIDPVTGKETGYSIVYDPVINKFTYEWGNPVKDSVGNIIGYEGIASATRPTETKTIGTNVPKPDSIILSTPTKLTGGLVGPVQPPPPVSTGGVKNITQDILNLTGIKPSTGTGAGTGAGTTTGVGTVKPPTGGTGGGVTAGTAGGTTAETTAGGTTAGGAPTGTIPAEVIPSAPTGVVPSAPITPTVPTTPSDTTVGDTTGTIPKDTAGAGTTGGAPSGVGTGAGESTTIGTGTETGTGAGAGAGTGAGADTGTGTGAGTGGEGTGGEGAGEGEAGKGGEGEGIGGGGGGGEGEGEGEGTGTEPMTEEDLILLGLISGGEKGTPKPVSKSTTAAMQALSQALRIGDPGEPLFGSRLGKRKNVWNVESLRIKDELGG
jgi:hypothetical protein